VDARCTIFLNSSADKDVHLLKLRFLLFMIDYNKEFGLEPLHYYCDFDQDFKLEEFRPIKDYEGLYEISDLGRVKSLERKVQNNLGLRTLHARIMISAPNHNGYLRVNLSRRQKKTRFSVHQLVAIAFLGHDIVGMLVVINHKNFCRTCNVKTNLEITSPRENSNQKHRSSSSVYTGVHRHSHNNRWVAEIHVNGKGRYLGSFVNEEDAAKAYELALNEINLL